MLNALNIKPLSFNGELRRNFIMSSTNASLGFALRDVPSSSGSVIISTPVQSLSRRTESAMLHAERVRVFTSDGSKPFSDSDFKTNLAS